MSAQDAFEQISLRDAQVAALLAEGYDAIQVGRQLHISRSAVYRHIDNFCDAIGGRDRRDVIRFWVRHGEAYTDWHIGQVKKRLRREDDAPAAGEGERPSR